MLLITLSGPQHSRDKTIKALKGAGFRVLTTPTGDPDPHDWGHPAESDVPTCFLTCEGDDVNLAVETIDKHKWRLRSHRDMPEPVVPSDPGDVFARLGLTAQAVDAWLEANR